ncbi:putative tripartite motif-containing protein 75 [Galemys pyrenaicus]|uniref:Putative tripartite motif-containing protein 75 n=1 Tax=Galemys pyrenaicus TaxID=202257 RepID=A0A8J6AFK1_GALPY|nr:putative tripartite motif-containing protein 75 [Galemys pyrenaicus]
MSAQTAGLQAVSPSPFSWARFRRETGCAVRRAWQQLALRPSVCPEVNGTRFGGLRSGSAAKPLLQVCRKVGNGGVGGWSLGSLSAPQHSDLASCIRYSWRELQDTFPCPTCCHPNQGGRWRGDPQLVRITDIATLLYRSMSKRKRLEERHLCEEHLQVLGLFCEDDLQMLWAPPSPLCSHLNHQVRPVEEATAEHSQRRSSYLEALKQLPDTQEVSIQSSKNLRTESEDGKPEVEISL